MVREEMYPSIVGNLVPIGVICIKHFLDFPITVFTFANAEKWGIVYHLKEQSSLWKFDLEDVCALKAKFIFTIFNEKWPRDGYMKAKTCPQ